LLACCACSISLPSKRRRDHPSIIPACLVRPSFPAADRRRFLALQSTTTTDRRSKPSGDVSRDLSPSRPLSLPPSLPPRCRLLPALFLLRSAAAAVINWCGRPRRSSSIPFRSLCPQTTTQTHQTTTAPITLSSSPPPCFPPPRAPRHERIDGAPRRGGARPR
jgi:hypothetical protein